MPFFEFLVPLLTSLATSAASAGISKAIGGSGGADKRLSDLLTPEAERNKKIPLSGESTAAALQSLKPATSLLGGGEDAAARERRLRMLRGI